MAYFRSTGTYFKEKRRVRRQGGTGGAVFAGIQMSAIIWKLRLIQTHCRGLSGNMYPLLVFFCAPKKGIDKAVKMMYYYLRTMEVRMTRGRAVR